MAPRTARKSGKASQRHAQAVDVLDALANKLAQLGRRKWKLADLEAALDKAVEGLPDEALRSHIRSSLHACATSLLERLTGLQAADQPAGEQHAMGVDEAEEQPKERKAAKRARRGRKAAAAAAEAAPAVAVPAPERPAPSLATAAGYRAVVAVEVAGAPDARFSPAAVLLARKGPQPELVAAHLRRVLPELPPAGADAGSNGSAGATADPGVTMAAARAALGVCSALAAEAGGPAEAVLALAPAVGQLEAAARQLAAAGSDNGAEGQQGGAAEQEEGQGRQQALLRELSQLTGRALACMHAALQQQQLVTAGGSAGAAYWRAKPQRLSPVAAHDTACSAAASLCWLLAELRHGQQQQGGGSAGGQRQQLEAAAAFAAADVRLLAPFAASGLLLRLAMQAQEEACGSQQSAQTFLTLYQAAAKQELAGAQDYLARLAAARKAAAVAQHLGQEALSAAISADACALPASQAFVGWLREQPPSGIVSAALEASGQGLDALSTHLASECGERALAGLLAAMRTGGGPAAAAGGAEQTDNVDGEGGAAAAGAMDDLLFFADTRGDATMFGRDWHVGSEDESEDEEEGAGAGLQLGDLPGSEEDEGRPQGRRPASPSSDSE